MANPNPPAPPDNTGKQYHTLKINQQAQMFGNFYLSPASPTFMNVRASAIRAGYSETYANNITVQRPKWWVELTETADYRRAQMLNKAENRLDERLSDVETDDVSKMKLQADVAKFVSERLGKGHYSTRQEMTGADGRALFSKEARESANMPLNTLFKGVKATK